MKRWIFLFVIIILYLGNLYFTSPEIFHYRFNNKLIKQYLCSQDIPNEVPCKREFLSDGELHIAAGYLYAKGYDPTKYHFQHTPLLKYLYGFTTLFTGNPYNLEIVLVILYLVLSYIFTWLVFKSHAIAIISCLFRTLGPLLRMLSGDASFEVGQADLMLIYGMVVLYKPKNFWLQGIILGLFASAKFWGAVPFFIIAFNGYNLIKKRLSIKTFFLQLVVGFLVFLATYIVTFINNKGNFNIIFFQMKMLKYWLEHSVATVPFSSLILFLTGYYQSWWANQEAMRGEVWNLLWPISIFIAFLKLKSDFFLRKITKKTLFAFIPITYLIYLGPQTPFVRYFIIILPFLYPLTIDYILNINKVSNLSKKKKE
jgi:hypothetical protein